MAGTGAGSDGCAAPRAHGGNKAAMTRRTPVSTPIERGKCLVLIVGHFRFSGQTHRQEEEPRTKKKKKKKNLKRRRTILDRSRK